jgi:hypothetical protein
MNAHKKFEVNANSVSQKILLFERATLRLVIPGAARVRVGKTPRSRVAETVSSRAMPGNSFAPGHKHKRYHDGYVIGLVAIGGYPFASSPVGMRRLTLAKIFPIHNHMTK